jgi:hypothetical protein
MRDASFGWKSTDTSALPALLRPHPPPLPAARSLVIAQPPILKPKVALLPLTPAIFPIKVKVPSLLVILCDGLGVVCPLEPGEVLLVEPPVVPLELLGGEPLLVCPRVVVEYEEELVQLESLVDRFVLEYGRASLRVV